MQALIGRSLSVKYFISMHRYRSPGKVIWRGGEATDWDYQLGWSSAPPWYSSLCIHICGRLYRQGKHEEWCSRQQCRLHLCMQQMWEIWKTSNMSLKHLTHHVNRRFPVREELIIPAHCFYINICHKIESLLRTVKYTGNTYNERTSAFLIRNKETSIIWRCRLASSAGVGGRNSNRPRVSRLRQQAVPAPYCLAITAWNYTESTISQKKEQHSKQSNEIQKRGKTTQCWTAWGRRRFFTDKHDRPSAQLRLYKPLILCQ